MKYNKLLLYNNTITLENNVSILNNTKIKEEVIKSFFLNE